MMKWATKAVRRTRKRARSRTRRNRDRRRRGNRFNPSRSEYDRHRALSAAIREGVKHAGQGASVVTVDAADGISLAAINFAIRSTVKSCGEGFGRLSAVPSHFWKPACHENSTFELQLLVAPQHRRFRLCHPAPTRIRRRSSAPGFHASGTGSGDDFTDHFPMHVRQSIVATTVTIRESFVIESHQMKNGRVQIMDMHTVLHSRQTKLIR